MMWWRGLTRAALQDEAAQPQLREQMCQRHHLVAAQRGPVGAMEADGE
jgi:hypothetical protein